MSFLNQSLLSLILKSLPRTLPRERLLVGQRPAEGRSKARRALQRVVSSLNCHLNYVFV